MLGAVVFISLAGAGCPVSKAADDSAAIVDVRFNAPFRQIGHSMGDEWAPTWGPDDVLYTGNNDGTSFGGLPSTAIAFGKLEGNDPYSLKGTTINGMTDYREGRYAAEAAIWKTMETYTIDGTTYRFLPCGIDADRSTYSCLVFSSNRGEDRTKNDFGIGIDGDLFRGTKFRNPKFISIRKTYESSMGKAGEYAFVASFAGTVGGEDSYFLGRIPIGKLPQKSTVDWQFRQDDWKWRPDLEGAAPVFNTTGRGDNGANWKTTNSYSVDGVIYMFVTRCTYPSDSSDGKRRHLFQDSSIIMSKDNGGAWIRTAESNMAAPMFPGMRFGAAYFVWYGKDGSANVDNADRYIYAVSNNGHFEHGDNYIIGRVSKENLPNLDAADWSFYVSGDGMLDRNWTEELKAAKPVLTNPGRSSMTGMTYIEGLRRYVLVAWHYKHDNFEAAIAANDLSTVLEFFEAPKPWGPWTKVKTFETGRLGWFTPIVGQRFQTSKNRGSVDVFLYASGFNLTPEGGLDSEMYKLNYMPLSLSTRPFRHQDSHFVGGR